MPHPVDVHVGRRIEERRRSLGMSQSILAEKVGVKYQQISKYENGDNRLSVSRLWDVAVALRVPVSYFFDGLSGQPTLSPEQQITEEIH